MKKIVVILLFVFVSLNILMAQELTVKSFVYASTDLTAQTEGRKDLNGDVCALVKIFLVGDIADVEGNVVKPLVKKNGQTWVFMTQGSKQMQIITQNSLPLMVIFADYGIDKLQSNRTYVLTLAKSSGASESQQMQTLTIKYSPTSAMVLVDNKLVKGSNGIAQTKLPIGQHSYIIACDGYESEDGMVNLKSSAPSNLQITLSKAMSSHDDVAQVAPSVSTQPSVMSQSAIPEIPETLTVPVTDGVSIEMVRVEAGGFSMGATPEMEKPTKDEKPVHHVTLTNDYYIGKYEVTQALWQAVMGNNPSKFKGDDLPVERVSWNDCQEFISKLNSLTGKHFRLPTEAEWEFAARGGNKSRGYYQYSGSNTLGDVAWYGNNSGSKTHSVGTKQPNELGIYDMSGNVSEWCQDRYGKYSESSQTNPTGSVSGSERVLRGGSWYGNACNCRSSCRGGTIPRLSINFLGLRLVLSEYLVPSL